MLLTQAAARQSTAGTRSRMSGHSLGMFSIRNPLRFMLYRVMFSQVMPCPSRRLLSEMHRHVSK
jgi:hypothetical protein